MPWYVCYCLNLALEKLPFFGLVFAKLRTDFDILLLFEVRGNQPYAAMIYRSKSITPLVIGE